MKKWDRHELWLYRDRKRCRMCKDCFEKDDNINSFKRTNEFGTITLAVCDHCKDFHKELLKNADFELISSKIPK